ncbi:MAG: hypothetical protein ACTJHC_00755 [Vagococcus sp.]
MTSIDFEFLKQSVSSDSPTDFLHTLKQAGISDLNGYLLFNLDDQTKTFYQNLDFLADDSVWTKEELITYTLVAQTIDNDYLLATSDTVLVIPYHLYKEDSEMFNQSIWAFLTAYTTGANPSRILAQ